MMRAPTRAAIYAAELKVAQAKRDARDSTSRVRVALRATLARPTTLALIAAAGGLYGFWLARRPQPTATKTPTSTSASTSTAVATTSVAGVVLAFIVRYVMQHLPFILRQLWAVRQRRAARVGSVAAKRPVPIYSARDREAGRSESIHPRNRGS